MEDILIITSVFLPKPDANGLITQKIAKELSGKNYNIHILAVKHCKKELDKEIIDNLNISRLSKSNYSELLVENKYNYNKLNLIKFKRRIKNIINFSNFPNFEKEQTKSIVDAAKYIINENKVKNVISIHKPYVNIDALIALKKDIPKIKATALFLDPLDSLKKPNFMPALLYNLLIKKTMCRISESIDIVLLPKDKKQYITNNYDIKNVRYFEYPNFKIVKTEENREQRDSLKLIYAGTLDKDYRNPEVFLNVIKELNNSLKVQADIYGKNQDYAGMSTDNLFINYKGSIPQESLLTAYNDADVLVNISNKGISSIPSKIFELFSYGKPIINFVKEFDDPSLVYFKKYPLSFNFFEFKDYKLQIEELKIFLKNNLGENISPEILCEIYNENTIDFFVEQLETIFKNQKECLLNEKSSI